MSKPKIVPLSSPPRLFLTGYRGTGKTTVGRLVANALGWECVDTDDLIEQAAGKSIAEMFADEGEQAFRDLEERVVGETRRLVKTVVSLGGGAILRASTRELISKSDPVVWLTASPETIAGRLAEDESTATRRPNLTAGGGLDEVRRVLAEREPLYRECATLVLDTEGKSPESLAGEIVRWLGVPDSK